jgi:hypothetical protein
MQNTIYSTPCQELSSAPALSIVTIHHGFTAGIRTKEAVGWLRFSLGGKFQIHAQNWSYEELVPGIPNQPALRAAAEADVIIISAPDSEPIPPYIEQWLDTVWSGMRGRKSVLVALHEDDPVVAWRTGPFCQDLERQAQRWGIDFMRNREFDEQMDEDFIMRCLLQKESLPLARRRLIV